MTEAWIDTIWQSVIALSLGMARILSVMIIVPVFTGMQLKGMLRNSCAVGLSLFLLPSIWPSLNVAGLSTGLLIIKETLLGFLLAGLLSIPFWLFDWVGVLIDSQRGALNSSVFNPALGSDSLIGGLIKQSVILLLMTIGGIPLLLDVLWHSYQVWPPTQWMPVPTSNGISLWLAQFAHLFESMILYAAPIVACLLFVDFGMAILGLFSPHLQVSVLAMPVKSLLGLFLLVVYLPQLWQLATDEVLQIAQLTQWLALMFQ